MPLFDYKCPMCGRVEEVLMRDGTPVPECTHVWAGRKTLYLMERQPSAPSFKINGYSESNGYCGTTREIPTRLHGQKDMRITVKEG